MQTLQHSYRGISLVMSLNWDLLIYASTIALALAVGAYIGSI